MLFNILIFIAFLWVAHGFWKDYTKSKQPITKEEQEQLNKEIQQLKIELFHKSLYLKELASPWNPKPIKHGRYSYPISNQEDSTDSRNLMFISAEAKLFYLQSIEWQNLKKQRLTIAQHKCEYCGSVYQLQCHHITYERLTMEHIDDLIILCGGSNGCHQRIHNLLGYDRTTEYPISVLKD